ncbi:HAMP domain-containing sensor histidine kinase [Lachnospiraceae bacterium 46-15]
MFKKRDSFWITGFAAGTLLILIIGSLSLFFIKNSFITMQQAIIGKLYEKSPEICAETLEYVFNEDITEEAAKKGMQALISLGYTEKGGYYLYRHMGWSKIFFGILSLQGIFALLLLCLFFYVKKQNFREEEIVIQDIRNGKLQISKYRFLDNKVILEIAKLLDMLHAKEAYLSEKNKSIQAFIENIAHQIKTPLSCISISMDLMLEEAEQIQRERILSSFLYLNRIESLLKILLDIGRLESGKTIMHREPFCMNHLFMECRDILPDGKHRISILAEMPDENGIEYHGDYEWLKEAFLNILKNCLEHGSTKEPVSVSLSQTPEGIKIIIRDHGKGFSEKDLPYIFNRFYIPEVQKNSHTGIGLNLAKLVIEKHFGTLKAKNHEKGGAVFSIVLPEYSLKRKI